MHTKIWPFSLYFQKFFKAEFVVNNFARCEWKADSAPLNGVDGECKARLHALTRMLFLLKAITLFSTCGKFPLWCETNDATGGKIPDHRFWQSAQKAKPHTRQRSGSRTPRLIFSILAARSRSHFCASLLPSMRARQAKKHKLSRRNLAARRRPQRNNFA